MLDQLDRFRPFCVTLLRLVTAFLFWQHGLQKLFGVLEGNMPGLMELLWFAGILEFFGPLFIAAGLFTRPVAFLLSGEMAVAYFLSHFPRGFWPVLNGGERAALFCFVFLLLVATGPGRLALDNVFFGKDEKDAE